MTKTAKSLKLRVAFGSLIALVMLAQTTMGAGFFQAPVDETPLLRAASFTDVLSGGPCPPSAQTRSYNVTALPLPLSYNHFGDIDLRGALFVPQQSRDALLSDVGDKLVAAGLGEMGVDVLAMRDALAVGDAAAALEASTALSGHIEEALESGEAPRGRVDTSALAEPLVLRAYIGECVEVTVLNVLTAPVSFHAHALIASGGSGQSLGANLPDLVQPGSAVTYRVWIPNWPGMEGAHFVHSHADPRDQTRHGLFGSIVAEPVGSRWLSMKDGVTEAPTGLDAIIDMPAPKADFREFVQIYQDEIDLVDWQLNPLPQVSPLSNEYGPGTKGISMRSEPFYDRFLYHDQLHEEDPANVPRAHDKSQSYGSYTYGDPATHFQESYLGDPVKFRMINAGPGQPHIHHLHGGGIRWRTSPVADDSQFDLGFKKQQFGNDPATRTFEVAASQRVDVQNINPGESFNIEPEGGTGGTQMSAGDFLYHCHIAEHYLAGMWSFWRAHNVKQPHLAELPDRATISHDPAAPTKYGRARAIESAVPSTALLGRTIDGIAISDTSVLQAYVASMLPAKGVPGVEDASVWDWMFHPENPTLALGEPDSPILFPNWKGDAPLLGFAAVIVDGEEQLRPVLGFDPVSGRLAYPHLRPHFGERPPFAPEHGGAPYLGRTATTDRPDGLCPSDAVQRDYNVAAIPVNISLNGFDHDKNGEVMARVEDRADYQSGAKNPSSIVLRANAGDCVNVLFTSALKETDDGKGAKGIHRKTNIHIHLVQFDVQASDGVVAGFNYETTVRPLQGADSRNYTKVNIDLDADQDIDAEDERIWNEIGENKSTNDPSAPVMTTIDAPLVVANGMTTIKVADIAPFLDATGAPKIGSSVGVGLGIPGTEIAKLDSVDVEDRTITLSAALGSHAYGEMIGYEFVRYQWFPDVELGIVYFHDHVNGLDTWRHGLFGSLIVEPRNSTWLSPRRLSDVNQPNQPTEHIVDIITPDPSKSFREVVLHFQDRACRLDGDCINFGGPEMPDPIDEPAAFNLRSEPLHRRNVDSPFSTVALNADATGVQDSPDVQHNVLRAYPGDQVEIRYLYAGQAASRGTGTFGVTGHRFQVEESLPGSRTQDTMSVAESSHHNWRLECGAGGCAKQPGDYLYYMTNPEYIQRGAWGLIKVLPSVTPTLAKLPSNTAPAAGTFPTDVDREYNVSAIVTSVNHNPVQNVRSDVKRFVLSEEAPALMETPADMPPSPLVLRAKAGELIKVNLKNELPPGSGRVGLHAGLVTVQASSQGFDVGANPVGQTVDVGDTITYYWYADRELGMVDLVSLADPVLDANAGLYGALIVEPANVTDITPLTGPSATLTFPGGKTAREHVLLFSSEDSQFDSSTMPYLPDVQGLTLVNYATEPLSKGANAPTPLGRATLTGVDTCQVDDGCGPRPLHARNPLDPYMTQLILPFTPVLDVEQGQTLILRVGGAAGDQQIAFHLDGHAFATDPDMANCRTKLEECKSNLVSTFTLGARETRNVWIPNAGLGGAGDYLYRNHREAFFEAGAWGILRVSPP